MQHATNANARDREFVAMAWHLIVTPRTETNTIRTQSWSISAFSCWPVQLPQSEIGHFEVAHLVNPPAVIERKKICFAQLDPT